MYRKYANFNDIATQDIVRRNMSDMTWRVETLYRLFLMVDMSKPRSQDIISGGCAKISLVAFS